MPLATQPVRLTLADPVHRMDQYFDNDLLPTYRRSQYLLHLEYQLDYDRRSLGIEEPLSWPELIEHLEEVHNCRLTTDPSLTDDQMSAIWESEYKPLGYAPG